MKGRRLFRRTSLVLFLAGGVMAVLPCPTTAATKAFLKLPGVSGSATDRDHQGWIAVESFSWGATRSGTTPIGSGATGAVRGFGEIKITKNVDSASPLLTQHATNGHSYGEVKIETWRPDGKPGYRVFVMKDVRIVSRVIKGMSLKPGQPRPIKPGGQDMEEVTLNYAEIHWGYTNQPGADKGAADPATWKRK